MEYVDSITLEIDGTKLDDVIVELSEKNERSVKAVNTLSRRRRAKGFKRGNNMYSLDLKVEPVDDDRVPSWHKLKEAGTLFSIRRTKNTGAVTTWSNCTVSSVSETESDGDSSMSVSVQALNRDP